MYSLEKRKKLFFLLPKIASINIKQSINMKKFWNKKKSNQSLSSVDITTNSHSSSFLSKNQSASNIKTIRMKDLTKTIFMNKRNDNFENNKEFPKEINLSTIRSNGKFKGIINSKLNSFNQKDNNKLSYQGVNISYHYFGNILNKKFVTKKILQHNHYEKSIFKKKIKIIAKNAKKDNVISFKRIDFPNNSSTFDNNSIQHFFPRVKNIVNNEKLFGKLLQEMTNVVCNNFKEYSKNKDKEKKNFYNILDSFELNKIKEKI